MKTTTSNLDLNDAIVGDFGVKMTGARKDQVLTPTRSTSNTDMRTLPFAKLWPKSSVTNIKNTALACVTHCLRADVLPKPRNAYKLERWLKATRDTLALLQSLERDGVDKFRAEMRLSPLSYRSNLSASVDLLEQLPRGSWDRVTDVVNLKNAQIWEVGTGFVSRAYLSVRVDGESYSAPTLEALTSLVQIKLATAPVKTSTTRFEVRGNSHVGYFVNKKGDPERRILAKFETIDAAFTYIRDERAALLEEWETTKNRLNVKKTDLRSDTNRPRVGIDHLQGRDVTPEMFLKTFGFRGVEFGNWVSQGGSVKDRQGMLNSAFEAFHDLARITGLPPAALSLNGTLGMAFGSRGSGWAAAHYEPGTVVINVTKTKGAGCLAHEWFHALDNYFQRMRNPSGIHRGAGDYLTQNPEAYYEHEQTKVRMSERTFRLTHLPHHGDAGQWELVKEVDALLAKSFSALVEAVRTSPMRTRAARIDKGKGDGYWSRTIELTARSFENYVIEKMTQEGYHNDYLANVIPAARFVRDKGRYPYLRAEELPPIIETFDRAFERVVQIETAAF